MNQPFTKEDDEEISLHSFDSTRSGESVEYARNASGYISPPRKANSNILPAIKEPRSRKVEKRKKRRIQPVCLQATFPDICRQSGICFSCNAMCQTKVFNEFFVCNICTQYAVGVPLTHPKIKLIIQLRIEHEQMRFRLEVYEEKPCTRESIDLRSRCNAMDRIIAGLIYDRTDLTQL